MLNYNLLYAIQNYNFKFELNIENDLFKEKILIIKKYIKKIYCYGSEESCQDIR